MTPKPPPANSRRWYGICAGRASRPEGCDWTVSDLGVHARAVRSILDDNGLEDLQIFSSGNLDEFALRDLLPAGAPIDGFGVGTRLDTSSDAPYLDCAYKLQEYAGRAQRNCSEGKPTLPGRKQVYRWYGETAAWITTWWRRNGKPIRANHS